MIIEACLRVVDKYCADSAKAHGCTKAGDVIDILPEGSDWGSEIMASEDYRIVRLDIDDVLQVSLLAGEPPLPADETGSTPDPEATMGRSLIRRTRGLDLASMPTPFAQQIIDNVTTVTDLTAVNISALTSVRSIP